MSKFPYVSEEDRRHIENKYHLTDQPFDGFKRMAYHGYAYDESTGLSDEEIRGGLEELADSLKDQPRPVIKASAMAYVLDHTRIDVNGHDWFVGLWSWNRLPDGVTVKLWDAEVMERAAKEYGYNRRKELSQCGAASLPLDFDHTVPDYDSMLRLGFPGLLKRLENSYRNTPDPTEKQTAFYRAAKIEYEAVLRLLDRFYDLAVKRQLPRMAACLRGLRSGAPRNTYEVLQLIYIYFMVSECVEHYQVRSLGYGLDDTLLPYFQRDLAEGTFSREELVQIMACFLLQFYAMGNYWGQPMYLAGTNADGSTRVNELSYLLLDIFDALQINNPKLQIKVGRATPQAFLDKALEMVRGGMNNMVFVSEDTMVKAMMRTGATYEQAIDSVIKGCYEYALKNHAIGISYSTFSALKPVSLVMHNGMDLLKNIQLGIQTGDVTELATFEQFYDAYRRQFAAIIADGLKWLDMTEPYIHDINPTTFFSVTVPGCVEKLQNANDGGLLCISNVWLNALGSAVDALMAVKELVYDTKTTTLAELRTALERNWQGYERLRRRALACKHRYGNGDPVADHYACAIHQFFASQFAGKKNCWGGHYEYELHSARSFIEMGSRTEATPDGRFAGDETSKNASPAPGSDKKGVTALIRSATTLDLSLSDSGACLDCMLHPSAVEGEAGLQVLRGVLRTYMERGGAAIHFNIFSSDVLRKAQEEPEKYRNLQVRVCGWNTRWVDMARKEQEAYILRAENIQ